MEKCDRHAAPVETSRELAMNRRAPKLKRLAAVVAVLSAFALPCAGWGWEVADNGASSDATTAVQAG
jgi:hypothetical protein